MPVLLERLWALHLLVLEGSGAAARLASLPLAAAPAARPFWATLLGAALLLLLHAALAAGRDVRVRAFRAGALLLAMALPMGGARVPASGRAAYGAAVLLVVAASGMAHAALSSRRRPGLASRTVDRARLALESAGLVLFLWAALTLARSEPVPVRLAFWALFLLRLSVADLLRPSMLVFESGLPGSAVSDLKRAAGAGKRRRSPPVTARLSRVTTGIAKGALAIVWLALPFLATLARPLVSRGAWPREALLLEAYPPLALGGSAALLLLRSARLLPSSPLRGVRGGLVALASLLYLLFAYRDPAFAAYRTHLPGILLVEALAGLLLGTAARAPR